MGKSYQKMYRNMGKNIVIVFLSWHDSLPGLIKVLYDSIEYKKYFISTGFIKGKLIDSKLMSNSNSFKIENIHNIILKLNSINATHVVVWNGDFNDNERGRQRVYLNEIEKKFKIVYCEHGWLPQSGTFTIDLEGPNGSSSISKLTKLDNSINKDLIKSKRLEYNSLIKNIPYSNYTYIPLQINTDTQITEYSPNFKSMESFILHICKTFKDITLLIKAHPKDSIKNKEIYRRICSQYKNTIFVDDTLNISYLAKANNVIAINSTVINEALLFNKSIMTYGINNFSNKGITYEIKDISDIKYQHNFFNFKPDYHEIEKYLSLILNVQYNRSTFDINKIYKQLN
jgi:hypothetical protein